LGTVDVKIQTMLAIFQVIVLTYMVQDGGC